MEKLIEYRNTDKTDKKKKFAQFYIQEYKGMIECIENKVKERNIPFLEFELVCGDEYRPAFEVETEDIIKFLNGLIKECEEIINGKD